MKRIEYIDAMRGFTMILVVIAHVSTFGLGLNGVDVFSIHKILAEFRMPLFFFTSGFVFYKSICLWNTNDIISFLRKKIPVQIISPLLFLICITHVYKIDIMEAIIDKAKYGYWFTFTLFQFYIVYILIYKIIIRNITIKEIYKDLVLLLIGLMFYIFVLPIVQDRIYINENLYNTLSIDYISYILFFFIGIITKKHFQRFNSVLNNNYFISICIIIFFSFNIFKDFILEQSNTTYALLTSLSGIFMVFIFFKKNETHFCNQKILGKSLQYIGKRTLDIYLIHYFFIYSNLNAYLPDFSVYKSPFIEFLISLFIGILIILFSLLVSNILRLSPFISHYLFGVPTTKK